MAGDVVILLSDDSDSDGAFVTPNPRTASPSNRLSSARRSPGTGPPPRLNLPRPVPAQTPAPAPAPATARRNVDVIEIDDTPAPSAAPPRARPSIPADDFLTSPFSGAFPTPRPQALSQTPSQPQSPPPLSTHRSPLQESMREKAARAAMERLRASQAHDREEDDDDEDDFRQRPAKRQRLSPGITTHAKTAQTNTRPAKPSSPSPFVDSAESSPRRSLPVQLPSSPAPLPLNAQRLSRFSHSFDFDDDIDDDIDDWSPSRRTVPAQPPARAPIPARQPDRQPARQSLARPKPSVECIDLLSSSDSERERSRSTTGPPAADSDFVDIDDLLATPSPHPRKQAQPEPAVGSDFVDIDDLVQSQPAARARPPPAGHRRELSDEILLLSSPSVVSPAPRARNRPTVSAPAPAPQPRQQRPLQRTFSGGSGLVFSDEEDDEYDEATADALLAEWRASRKAEESVSPSKPSVSAPSRPKTKAPARRRSSFDEATAAERQRLKRLESEEKRKEKVAEKERRQKEKEVDRERRKIAANLAKEKKAKEKAEAAAFNDANKSRLDKAVATPEMIVRLPSTLPQATKEVAQGMLADVKASHEEWASRPVDNVVTWRRKVSNEYKPDLGHWVPVSMHEEDERHALVVLKGDDFVQLILARDGDPDIRHQTGGHDLDSHVARMKREYEGYTILYLIEGLNAWRSRNKTIRNRQFAAAVRGGESAPASSSTATAARPSQRLGRRGQKQPAQHLDESLVDDALLDLQIEHSGSVDDDKKGRLLVHETASSLDTARWIRVFTEQIAIARYRQQREQLYAAAASFCMDSGQIATGDDAADMYILMLQQTARVTEPIAMGVAARFDNVPALLKGFAEEGPLALEACLRSRNRNGALSDRTVGQALSRRLHKVFTGRDPESTDV